MCSNDDPLAPANDDGSRVREPTRWRRSPGAHTKKTPDQAGSLQRMNDIPLDIVYEIFLHLQPPDLLSLSRTSRRLRQLLLSRDNARYIWKTALENTEGLPPRPADLTEPQYASLAFDTHCDLCNAENVQEVHWTCRIRCCKRCVKKAFITQDELDSWISEEVYMQKLSSVFPYIIVVEGSGKQPMKALYYTRMAKTYLSELEDVLSSGEEDHVVQWLKTKKEVQLERIKHATLCETWYQNWLYRDPHRIRKDLPVTDVLVTTVLTGFLVYLWRDWVFS